MIEKNKKTNKYHAVCDCCYEYSDEYGSLEKCQHGIKYNGWEAFFDEEELEWKDLCPSCKE